MKLTLFPNWQRSQRLLGKALVVILASVGIFLANDLAVPQSAAAYPFWAQQTYPITPREPTGRIVCANCHLAAKPSEIEVPQSIAPDTVFEAVVKIPYDQSIQQVTANGVKGPLNVGAVLMLPPGFKIAPEDRLSPEMKEKTEGLYFQPYGEGKDNIVIIGPLPGDKYQEITRWDGRPTCAQWRSWACSWCGERPHSRSPRPRADNPALTTPHRRRRTRGT